MRLWGVGGCCPGSAAAGRREEEEGGGIRAAGRRGGTPKAWERRQRPVPSTSMGADWASRSALAWSSNSASSTGDGRSSGGLAHGSGGTRAAMARLRAPGGP
ncbi:unnamed protein product [Prorocentrum cordatum]|uniref:Uncharacterized protein n=1 Tax=Prorocentrum cordatum TaxID=2364126 RepID=A0ABN9U4B2_9DINO|nr:unnamed protein product [Polarella glacialis]